MSQLKIQGVVGPSKRKIVGNQHEHRGHLQKCLHLDFFPKGLQGQEVRLRTFSGAVFHRAEAVEELLRDCDEVWFVALETGYTYTVRETTLIEEGQADCLAYLEEITLQARELGKTPQDVPWLLILNQVIGVSAGSGIHLREHSWFQAGSVPTIEINALDDIQSLLEFFRSDEYGGGITAAIEGGVS